MFYFGYDNYMEHAFPEDELDPIHCTGRGHKSKLDLKDSARKQEFFEQKRLMPMYSFHCLSNRQTGGYLSEKFLQIFAFLSNSFGFNLDFFT